MNRFYRILLSLLNSRLSVISVIAFCILSFFLGLKFLDMNIFAASGGVMTVFGLLSMIQFTTIEKFLNQEEIAANSTGVTGPPISQDEYDRIVSENVAKAKVRLKKELRSELKGLSLTVVGTLIWAYGAYIPH